VRVVFMGKSKRSAVRALDWLVEQGVELPAIVAPEPEPDLHESQRLDLAARRHGLPLLTEAELYDAPPDDVDQEAETAFSLDVKSQDHLLELFQGVVGRALAGEPLPREPQGEGRYLSRAEFDDLRVVRPGDDLPRKLRAFWYPPWPGAVVDVDGRRLTLVDDALLAQVAAAYRDAGLLP